MASKSKKKTKKKVDSNRNKLIAAGPPHPALPGTRWVRGSDGKWMLHESKDPGRWKV
jgi:hypothetical protein